MWIPPREKDEVKEMFYVRSFGKTDYLLFNKRLYLYPYSYVVPCCHYAGITIIVSCVEADICKGLTFRHKTYEFMILSILCYKIDQFFNCST